MKKLLFLYNAHSGREKIKSKLVSIIDIFAKAGFEITVHPTQAKDDATNTILTDGKHYDTIVVSGGDGTLDEAVKGMIAINKKIPLGYIPAGSTNDFAKSMGISSDMTKAAETVIYGEEFPCDVGRFNDSYFVYIAACGILTEVSYETKQEYKNVFGHMAYVLEGIRSVGMGNFKPIEMTINVGDRVIKDSFIYGMVSNSTSVGGFKSPLFKEVQLNDGKFEGIFVRYPEDPTDLNAVLASLIAGEPDAEYMYYFKASEFTITSEEPVAWTLDGENGGSHTEINIKNLKQAVTIFKPVKKKK
ncbi:MAG: YegS/Rv2252/BmrU family lipid kinase [Lachnospiraceae bacterium]|nr:YegS/Rv2252/BmrU family lipid kinase [Lachnospiraceae bacterium]